MSDHLSGLERAYSFLDEGEIERADRLLDDCWILDPFPEEVCLDGLPTWTEDPLEERYWRFVFYALRPTRHLLYAWRETGNGVYLDKLRAILGSLVLTPASSNPYLWDPHTVAYRALVLTNIFWKLYPAQALDPALAHALQNHIRDCGSYLADPDHFEGNYNHGLNEATALLAVATNFPQLLESAAWEELARSRFVDVFEEILDGDGVEVEQSPFYHLYVLAKAWELRAWTASGGGESAVEQADLDAMVRYARIVAMPDAQLPLVGATGATSLASYAPSILDEIAAEYPRFDYVRSRGESGEEPDERLVLFEDSGQAVLRTGYGTADELATQTWAWMDVGPYRWGTNHLDALSVVLYADGEPMLRDAGLYSYERDPVALWFKGTSAHNTLVVDGEDQDAGSAQAGTSLVHDEGWLYQSGRHGLYSGVQVNRGLFLLDRGLALVLDEVQRLGDTSPQQVQLPWHLSPHLEPAAAKGGVMVRDAANGVSRLRMALDAEGQSTIHLVRGREEPMQGWFTERYETREPAWAVVVERGFDASPLRFATALGTGSYADRTLSVQLLDEGQVEVRSGSHRWRVQVSALGSAEDAPLVEAL